MSDCPSPGTRPVSAGRHRCSASQVQCITGMGALDVPDTHWPSIACLSGGRQRTRPRRSAMVTFLAPSDGTKEASWLQVARFGPSPAATPVAPLVLSLATVIIGGSCGLAQQDFRSVWAGGRGRDPTGSWGPPPRPVLPASPKRNRSPERYEPRAFEPSRTSVRTGRPSPGLAADRHAAVARPRCPRPGCREARMFKIRVSKIRVSKALSIYR